MNIEQLQNIYSKRPGFIASLFDLSLRRPRLSFFLTQIAVGIISTVQYAIIGVLLGSIPYIGGIFVLLAIIITLALMVANWFLIIQRLHDLDKSGWWSLILFIPVVDFFFCIYLLFFRGTVGPNRWGKDPLIGNVVVNVTPEELAEAETRSEQKA